MSALAPRDARWYYARDRKKVGPLTWDQLRLLIATGQLTPSDMLLRDREGKWQAANTLPGLFGHRTAGDTKNDPSKRALAPLPRHTQPTGGRHAHQQLPVAAKGGAGSFPHIPGYEILSELGH